MDKIEIIKSFESYLENYQAEEKVKTWTYQSSRFKEFWNNRLINQDGPELSVDELDSIIKILDSHGKGNNRYSEAVAGVMIPQGAFRTMFIEIRNRAEISSYIDGILKAESDEIRAFKIDDLYLKSKNSIGYLTGSSGNAINCLLAAWDPFNNSSIVSLNHRILFLKGLGAIYEPGNDSIGLQIVKTNNYIRNFFHELGFNVNQRTISDFAYHSEFINHWKEEKPIKQSKGKKNKPKDDDYVDDLDQPKYWLYAPGRGAMYWEKYYSEGVIGIGPNALGDVRNYSDRSEITKKIIEIKNSEGVPSNDSLALWEFVYNIEQGDIIIAKRGRSSYLGYGIVQSDYQFDSSRNDYHHIRKVKWIKKGEWLEDTGPLVIKTLTDITKYPQYVLKLIKLIGINTDDSQGVQDNVVQYNNEVKRTSVSYWWLNANAKYWNIDNYQIGQVQSYTTHNETGNKRRIYEYFKQVQVGDLIIGYQTTPSLKIKGLFEVVNGISEDEEGSEVIIFKIKEFFPYQASWEELKSNSKVNTSEVFRNNQGSLFKLNYEEFNAIVQLCRQGPGLKLTPYKAQDALNEIFMNESELNSILYLLEYKKNLILQGPPGTGKTYIAKRLAYLASGFKDQSRIETIQFHQSYSYEDFIQGYRPVEGSSFSLQNGVFFEFCVRAQRDPGQKYFFIIDEINRGNLSKIFGELMMLIENDKRGKDFSISLTYSNQNTEKFYIPENLYIIGTMNTADRSLAIVDYALRRRFVFIDIKPAFGKKGFERTLKSNNVSDKVFDLIKSRIEDLNAVISSDNNLGRWFNIGHSYFCSPNNGNDLEWYRHIIINEIGPLLREYWFDDEEKAEEAINKLIRV